MHEPKSVFQSMERQITGSNEKYGVGDYKHQFSGYNHLINNNTDDITIEPYRVQRGSRPKDNLKERLI
jgi:hypothetical protein